MKNTRDITDVGNRRIIEASPQSGPVTNTQHSVSEFRLTTDEFAALNSVKGPSVRRRFCVTSSYFGIRPRKLINGRLVWPAIQIGIEGDI